MDISLSLDQKQILTQQMIQTLNILQMNTLELESYINEIAMENPVIDIVERAPHEEAESFRQLDIERKLEWLESTDGQNIVYYRDDEEQANREAGWQDIRDVGESLEEYLKPQLLGKEYSKEENLILYHIIEELDGDGYYTDDLESAAEFLGVSSHQLEQMLFEVQKLDPAGVGARNLEECLTIQLKRETGDPELIRDTGEIIREYLPLLGKKHLNVIARKMKVSLERVEECCTLICSMNPKPGNNFNDRDHFHYISPDVVVVKFEDYFNVLVNEYQIPAFQVNSYYEQLAKTTEDQEVRDYLKEKIRKTRELADSISYRISTFSRVANLLVEKQKDFFMYGPGHKKPLQLGDLAEELELHISTISRALSNKYLQCSWGIYPMNYFLATAVPAGANDETMTQENIIDRMEEIIAGEDKEKPYSDQKIADLLKERGIEISRRTVSKYRGIRNIPDKCGRKQNI
ncbi:MAG: RNA polymerase factor sigma-54 [Lachnospiraceae bacterium]|nr:RNA polymerase factor sigma-54 [Lachnospiraceae bacterium]